MQRLTQNRAFALLLGLWMALAPAWFVLPAAAMTMEMSLSDPASPGCCDECPASEWDCNVCSEMCRFAAQAATTVGQAPVLPALDDGGELLPRPIPFGHAPPPDPAPPKFVTLL